ncbi:TonB-dependent receptor [Novosphingobium sp. PhB57]|jgi:TonB-dependent receptor|uniref:TonB-dependent receptor n=1 Tax=unclassified Novosphingobium TaxID=2644732 RepID=UPI0010530F35|nr:MULTISPECIES: TonB-dependent receptor [unclassified Novosphingobium]TCU59444.1 TonB-dependent receptor [Novosphingobium sp. PhB57]TDW63903.1 TonB-dependent receptor [Novosphingobium sp. PhB55]
MKTSFRIAAGLLASASFATIAHAGEVAGSVHDASGVRPLQSASVRIVELNRSAETDRGGNFIFGDVPAGTYTLEARYVGAEVTTQSVSVAATGRIASNFDLPAIGGGDILVTGQTANLTSALSRQKAADGVVSVLTRDAVGQFPDQNVAESLRRLPGVNILNDQGEGRYVSVRGLDPDLNGTSINGVRMPAPESDARSVALDVVSSDTIESVEVKKSFTPDMDGDFIGASVEIKTTSAFDSKKNRYSLSAEGSWNDYSGKVTPKGSFDFTQKLGDDFGIAGSVSYYKRKFETDNVETGGWNVDDSGNAWAESVEYRDYDVERTRINAALSADWRVSDTTKAYVRGNWAQFDDHEYRRRTTLDFSDFDGPSSSTDSSATFDSDDERITVERDLKDRFERQRIRSVAIGSDTDTGTWKFNWQASYAKSSEKETFSIDPTRFRARFNEGVVVATDYANKYYPTYAVTADPDSEFNDASAYEFNKTELTTLSDSQDEEWAVKADLARTFAGDNGDFTVQAGAKARWRKKSYDFNMNYYELADGAPDYTLADVLGKQTYRLVDMGPVASKTGPADYLLSNPDSFVINDYESALNSAVSDYSVREDILAGYAMARWDSSTLRVIGGVRMERTHNELNGSLVTDNGDDTITIDPLNYKRNYTNWLPSLTLRFSPQQNLVARAAGYKTIVRPKLSQLAPRNTINDDLELEVGNPELKPYQAWNFDAGFDYYFTNNGALSIGGFYKSVKDYTYSYNSKESGVYNGIAYDELTVPVNGDTATIAGLEASFSQVFSMLPSPFDGLLTQINYTYTYARGTVFSDDDGTQIARRIALPNASKNTFNVVLGYEKGPVSLRAAGTFRDKYLDEVGDDAETDRTVNQHFQLDLSAKYKVTENIRLFADWVNVNNAKYFAYQNLGGAKRVLQYEEYGSTVKFGARVTF